MFSDTLALWRKTQRILRILHRKSSKDSSAGAFQRSEKRTDVPDGITQSRRIGSFKWCVYKHGKRREAGKMRKGKRYVVCNTGPDRTGRENCP